MNAANVQIFLEQPIPADRPELKAFTSWCAVNQKRWFRAAHVLAFKGLLAPKTVFFPPFTVVRATATCIECMQPTSVVGILAGGFAPSGHGQGDVAETIDRYLTHGIKTRGVSEIFSVYAREYPSEFLKLVRKHNFMFRRLNFGDDEWTEDTYYANICQHCRQPINDFDLFYEADGSFSRSNSYTIKASFPISWNTPLVIDAKFA